MIRSLPLLALAATTAFAGEAPRQANAPAPAQPDPLVARLESLASKTAHAAADTPTFAFTGNLTLEHPASLDEATMGMPDFAKADAAKTVVLAIDPTTSVISTHLGEYATCGKDGCKGAPDLWLRATAVFEKRGDAWQPVAWSMSHSIPSFSQQEAIDAGIGPDKLGRDLGGADDAVRVFESSIADPKAFSATLSERKELVMFGSELAERFAGTKAKSQLAAWSFAFTERDGVRAGLSKSGNVAWVAANLDARPAKQKTAKPIPFRVFAVYEKIATTWKLVQLQFSTAV